MRHNSQPNDSSTRTEGTCCPHHQRLCNHSRLPQNEVALVQGKRRIQASQICWCLCFAFCISGLVFSKTFHYSEPLSRRDKCNSTGMLCLMSRYISEAQPVSEIPKQTLHFLRRIFYLYDRNLGYAHGMSPAVYTRCRRRTLHFDQSNQRIAHNICKLSLLAHV